MTPTREAVRPTTLDTPTVPDTTPEKRPADAVVREIRLDTLDRPKQFLDEVVVPFGGE